MNMSSHQPTCLLAHPHLLATTIPDKGKGKGKAVQKRGKKRSRPQLTLAGKRARRDVKSGAEKKEGHPVVESEVVGFSEIKKRIQRSQETDISHWLNGVEEGAPPTGPPTPERD